MTISNPSPVVNVSGRTRRRTRGAHLPVNVSLRTKVILAFLVVSLGAVSTVVFFSDITNRARLTDAVGANLKTLAGEKALTIQAIMNKQINGLEALALNSIVYDSVLKANAAYTQTTDATAIQAALAQRDVAWTIALDTDPLIQSILTTAASRELQKFGVRFPDYADLFITDKYGATIAATNRTTKYYQADQRWWQEAYHNGQGAIYIGQPEFSRGLATFGVILAIPVRAPDSPSIEGVLHALYRIQAITDVLGAQHFGQTGEAGLLLGEGAILTPQGISAVSPEDLAQLTASAAANYASFNYRGQPRFVSQASVVLTAAQDKPATAIDLGWKLIVAQDSNEALNPISATERTTLIVGVLTLLATASVAAGAVQLLTRPIVRLTAVAKQISDGDLTVRATVDSGDEIGALALTFNGMTEQLRDMIAGLEQRVQARTEEISRANEQLQRHAAQIATGADVSRVVTTLLDPSQLISQVVNLIQSRFSFYYVGLFLVDEVARYAVLQEGTGEAGRVMKERGHRLEIGGQSMVGAACANKQARIALDVGQAAVRFANPLLPDTRSEMALPLRAGERVIGALDVQSTQVAAFDESDIATLQGMADQVAVALENARLFQQSQSALKELETTNRLLVREGWQGYLGQSQARRRAEFRGGTAPGVESPSEPLTVPLELRGQSLGRLTLRREGDRAWSSEEIEMIQAIALQTALSADNARLIEQTRQALDEARALYETSREITSAGGMSEVLSAVLDDLARTGIQTAAIALFDTPTREQAKYIELAGAWDYTGTPRLAPGVRFAIADFALFGRITNEGTLVSADLVADPEIDEMAKMVLGGLGLRGMAITPLAARGQWIGLLFALTEQAHTFTSAELNFHRALADQAAVAIDNRRLLAETQQRAQREVLIRQITTRIRAASDIQGVLEATAAELARSMGVSRAIVRLTMGDDGGAE